MTAKDEAKQLDSVTDRVTEQESSLDASKATAAMANLASDAGDGNGDDAKIEKIQVSQEDVELIVNELEVEESIAERTLQEVVYEGLVTDGKTAVGEALRRLVVSWVQLDEWTMDIFDEALQRK